MGSRIAWSAIVLSLVLVLVQAGPVHAQSAAGVWDMEVSGKLKGPGGKGTFAGTGTLTLNPDRTYTSETDGDPVVEEGVWFQDGMKLILFATNLLELIVTMEDEISSEVGEPVEIIPLTSDTKCVLNPKTGLLSIKNKMTVKAVLLASDTAVKLRVSTQSTGTRAIP